MIAKDLNHNFIENPIYHFGDEVAKICTPLFKKFSINYFTYGYICFRDLEAGIRKIVMLTSDAKWVHHYYLKKSYPVISNGRKLNFWQSFIPAKSLMSSCIAFDHYNGVVLGKTYSDRIEIIELAMSKPNQYPLEFCSNKYLLNKFLSYFREKTKDMLRIAENNPFYLPENQFLKFDLKTDDKPYDDFLKEIKTKRLSFWHDSKKINFTQQEFEVLNLFAKGKRAQEIGGALNISYRTVEFYLYNAKNKTKTYTTSRLIDCFSRSLF